MTDTPADRAPSREPLPKRFCDLDRLVFAMTARGLDGVVATTPQNVFYLTGFNPIAHKSDESRPCAVVLSRHAPEHPVMIVADYYLATFLAQPTWVEDLRPFRAVMMPLDLPPARSDIDRFIPPSGAGVAWLERARENYAFDFSAAVRALKPGEHTVQPVKTDQGWHVIQLLALRPHAKRPSLQAAKVWLQPQLVHAKVQAQQQQWREQAQIVVSSTP